MTKVKVSDFLFFAMNYSRLFYWVNRRGEPATCLDLFGDCQTPQISEPPAHYLHAGRHSPGHTRGYYGARQPEKVAWQDGPKQFESCRCAGLVLDVGIKQESMPDGAVRTVKIDGSG